jgi:hypothetical protein
MVDLPFDQLSRLVDRDVDLETATQFIMDLKNSTKEKLIFDCNMKTQLCNSPEDHVHKIILEFTDNGKHLKSSYLGWTDQKPNKKNSIYHFDKK